ncbi:MAG: hypothetical protein ACRD2B_17710, partial [Terriglobia bacterium]
ALAFTRRAFDAVGGLLDTCILGAGDWFIAFGLVGKPDNAPEAARCQDGYRAFIRRWQDRAYAAAKGNIGCVNQHAVHFYHGARVNRAYGSRWKILRDHQFDPFVDLYRDSQGLWQLTESKPRMRDAIRSYFLSRDEDTTS